MYNIRSCVKKHAINLNPVDFGVNDLKITRRGDSVIILGPCCKSQHLSAAHVRTDIFLIKILLNKFIILLRKNYQFRLLCAHFRVILNIERKERIAGVYQDSFAHYYSFMTLFVPLILFELERTHIFVWFACPTNRWLMCIHQLISITTSVLVRQNAFTQLAQLPSLSLINEKRNCTDKKNMVDK